MARVAEATRIPYKQGSAEAMGYPIKVVCHQRYPTQRLTHSCALGLLA